MKQVLENLRTGQISVADVAVPGVRNGTVLVRNHYSVISAGTEGATVQLGKMSLLGKARARPEQVRKVLNVVRNQGLLKAYQAASRSLDMPIPMGYSCAGEVIAVGPGVGNLRVGDRVACMGAAFAHHAEVVCVPSQLCIAVPDGVDLRDAAITTIGSIALNSLRVGDLAIGDRVVIIGLGLLGLLAAQLVRAAGGQVYGIDRDPRRVEFFQKLGYGPAAVTGSELASAVNAWSLGEGADLVLITASAPDNSPVALAGELARRRGRVVVLGRTEMTAPRETYLFKELHLMTAFSCGPGADDPNYELASEDYPVDLVRWSERRNADAFLQLLASGRVEPGQLMTHEFSLADAAGAFDLITSGNADSAAVVLRYNVTAAVELGSRAPDPVSKPVSVRKSGSKLRVSVIGAGSHATNEVIPALARLPGVELRGIASATGVKAAALSAKYGFAFNSSSAEAIIEDGNTDAVIVLTRHNSHADLAASALLAGKHVLVEKPLALTRAQLAAVESAAAKSDRVLKVGFNRRYAPTAVKMRKWFEARSQPLSISYRGNVGYRPPQHWLHDPAAGGGVLLGEACHYIDFCCWMIGAPVTAASVKCLRGISPAFLNEDNFHIELQFGDGSLGDIRYLSNGSGVTSREFIEIFGEGKSARLADFRALDLGRGSRRVRDWRWSADFGHRGQLAAFVAEASGGERAPSGFSDIESSRVTIGLSEQLPSSLSDSSEGDDVAGR